MLRIVTGLALLLILWASVVPSPAWVFVALMSVAITIGCIEACRMMSALGVRPLSALCLPLAWAVIGSVALESPAYPAPLALSLGTIVIVAGSMAFRESPPAMLNTIGGTVLPLLLALLLSYTLVLRNIPDLGRGLLLLLFLAVIAGDTAAFYVGRSVGRRKLAPKLSPHKTWEGAVGGVVAAIGATLLARVLWLPHLALAHTLILGFLLGSAGILGDLAESLLKRASGVKDSSGLLPGHGGILDRLDSLLFSGPILYYYYRYFLT